MLMNDQTLVPKAKLFQSAHKRGLKITDNCLILSVIESGL